MKRTFAQVAIATAILAFAGVARAEMRVVVVDAGDPHTQAATERLRGELAAAGLVVVASGAEGESVASVSLVRTAAHGTEVHVSDRLTGKTLVRRIEADPERAPRLVALRGVELLRASLLELESPPQDDAPPATPALAQPSPPEIVQFVHRGEDVRFVPTGPKSRGPWISRAAFDAGIAVLASSDRLGPATAPKLGAWLGITDTLAARVQLVGPAFLSGLSNAAGTAVVRQELASVDIAWVPNAGRVLAPFVAIGAGPYHLHVQGTASSPAYHGATNDVWAALFAAGLGLGVRIAWAVSLAAEGRVLAMTPHPAVSIGAERVASASPALLGSLSLVAGF